VLGGQLKKLLTGIISPVTFAPDGQRLAFMRLETRTEENDDRYHLVVAHVTGGNERILKTFSGLELFGQTGPSWSPDGKEIACQLVTGLTKNSNAVWQVIGVNVQSGAPSADCSAVGQLRRLAWLRNGSGVVIIGTAGRIGNNSPRFCLVHLATGWSRSTGYNKISTAIITAAQ
jgi:dipeptidyl aminopeptidase/acylaminoacyl peptidase